MSGHTINQRQEQALSRFNGLLDILQIFVQADQDTDVDTGGAAVPSLRKWLQTQRTDVSLAAFLGAAGKQGDALRVGEFGHGADELPTVEGINQLANQCVVNFQGAAIIHLPLVTGMLAVQLRLAPEERAVQVRFMAGGTWSEFQDILSTANTIADSNGLIRKA